MTKETKSEEEKKSATSAPSFIEITTPYSLVIAAWMYISEPGFSDLFYVLMTIIIVLSFLWFIILIMRILKRNKEYKKND
jgi:hypothetical protein